MKYQLTITNPGGTCSGWDGTIFKDTGTTENGEIKYAKNGTGPPYLFWTGAGQTLDPLDEGVCYFVDGADGAAADYTGWYAPTGETYGYPHCPIYSRTPAATPQALLEGCGSESGTPCVGSGGALWWELLGLSTSYNSDNNRDLFPAQGPYSFSGTVGAQVQAITTRAIPASTWIVSDYGSLAGVAAAWTTCVPPFYAQNGSNETPISGTTYTLPIVPGAGCVFDLAEYHYSSPSCYRVYDIPLHPGSEAMAGDYTFTGTWFPADDDNDYGVFELSGVGLLFYSTTAGCWMIGPSTDDDCCYASATTTKRTPYTGTYLATEGHTGRFRVGLCGGGLWFPWCCTPCPVTVVCGEDVFPRQFRVTVSGITGGSCTDSNGVHTLTFSMSNPDCINRIVWADWYPDANISSPSLCCWESPSVPDSGYLIIYQDRVANIRYYVVIGPDNWLAFLGPVEKTSNLSIDVTAVWDGNVNGAMGCQNGTARIESIP